MESLRKNAKWYLPSMLFLANILIWFAIFSESREGILTVAFLDVGQGDSVFIEAPNGNQMLIDGGPNRSVLKVLSEVMPFYDRSIDVVMATHPDKDHIGGLPTVLSRYDVDFFLESGVDVDTGVYNTLVRYIERNEIRRIVVKRGMKVLLDDDVYLLVLFPDRDVSSVDPNDASIIVKLVYNDTSFLLTGDSPKKIENFVVSLDRDSPAGELDIDVLKIGHHGSKTSTSELFLGFTSPEYTVISVGRDNRYSHPHEEVLAALGKFDIDILRTDERGTIIFESDGENLIIR